MEPKDTNLLDLIGVELDSAKIVVITKTELDVIMQNNQEARSPEKPGFTTSLTVVLTVMFCMVVVCSVVVYIALGFTSLGYYGATIGQLMQFVYNTAVLSGTALSALGVLLVLLHKTKRLRKYVLRLLKYVSDPEA